MNRFTKKLCCIISAALIAVPAMTSATVGEGESLALKEDSRLTIDRDNSGYLRGIWGRITAGELASEFEGDVQIKSGERVLEADDYVSSDDTVQMDEDSVPVLIYGDVNRDGAINLTDVSLMLKYVAKWNVEICEGAADLSVNGRCDLSDVTLLLKWIAGWDVSLSDAVFPSVKFKLDDGFKIVVPTDADEFEKEAASLIAEAIDSIYETDEGKSRIITDDKSSQKEILIGDTNRGRTAEAVAGIDGEFGWTYTVPNDRAVVIAGSAGMDTYEAAEAFLWDMFGYVNEYNRVGTYITWNGEEYVQTTASDEITAGVCRVYESPVPEKLTIGGLDISEYRIAADEGDASAASVLQRAILRETGAHLSIISSSSAISGGPVIRMGIGREDGTHFPDVGTDVFAVALDGEDIVIDVYSDRDNLFAARTFIKQYIVERSALPSDTVRLCGVNSNLLRQVNAVESQLADGVTYSELEYSDFHGMPVKAYLVKVENGAEHIIMGTPDNGTEISGVSATVMEAIEAAEDSGEDVIAGINGDFFHIESDYSPQGLCVKDGVILRDNLESRPWIAVMKDGSLDCGIAAQSRQKIQDMQYGFGASHVLLSNGLVYQDGQGSSFGEIRHPRTAMGYDDDGCVYLIVVDGRQPEISNGASLLDLTLMLKELGVRSAVNLDGGGSSTMIIDENGFAVKNSPSDGSLRSIFNSVLVVK